MERKEATRSEDPIYGASSSSTSLHVAKGKGNKCEGGDYEGGDRQWKGNDYEVFLSFRGTDTRKGFINHLYTSLVDAVIHVFKDDDELRIGEEIGQELLCNITQAKISIPIISENYASNKWCLHELVLMLKCKKSRGQIVLPIFYKVEPSQVRQLKGRLGDAINAHKENLDETVVKEWEEALQEVSSLEGWESEKIDNGHEGALIKMVVRKVMSELKRLFQLIVAEQLVGIDDHVEQIMNLIDDKFKGTKIIGIHGMGGIGKTTLANVLYNKLSSHFEYLSFVANIRETSQHKGIECLQKQLIYDIIGSSCDVSNVDEGIGVIKSRFVHKKVLILLDDMDSTTHLNALVGDSSWFKAGSIVIITTRNKSILDQAREGYMYPLNELSLDQSLILFSRHAFRKDSPQSDYEDISRDVVSTTGGLPLALEVIGSLLCGKKGEVWKDTLKKLKKVPYEKVQEKLQISYEALDYEEKQIFLDIACFFVGSSTQSPTYMWDACGLFPRKGIEVLILMSLIKIDEYGKLMMHDHLRDLGREIVHLENQKPQKRSRLWIYEDAVDVLDNSKGTSKIEALRLDKYGWGRSYTGEQFKELTNLRFLQVNAVNLARDFENLLPELRWLWWEDCPSDFGASNFHPKKLVVLDLSWSRISEVWGGWDPLKMATKLKVLNLSFCDSLRKTSDLSAFKSLEILILRECRDLEEIHPSIGDIKTLVSLDVRRCSRLKELPVGVGRMEELRELLLDRTALQEIPISRGGLMKLETLNALSCEELAQLPESMGYLISLTQLDLSETGIKELPESIGSMKELKTLDASYCASLARIPSSIGHLASLSLLDLTKCDKLAQLPDSIGSLVSLQRLLLRGCRLLREIPDSIGKLTSLTELDLKSTAIAELPDSIGNLHNLRILDIRGTHITKLPGAIGMLVKLQELSASCCENLEGLPSNIDKLVSLSKLDLDESSISGLPESISRLSSLQNLSVRYCERLRGLPKLPSGLIALDITCQSPPLPLLSQLTLLKKLTLSDCHWLERLPELPIGLSMLSVKRCGKLKASMDFSNLNNLYELIFDKCFELIEVTSLEGLQSLSNLHAQQCPKISRFDGVESLEFLRDLHIDEAFPDTSKLTSPMVSQLEGSLDLSNSKILQETNAASCMNLVEIQGLCGSKSSPLLDMSECTFVGQSLDLSSSKYLREVRVTNCKNLTEIRGLDGLESLEVLDISGCTSLTQSPELSDLKNLESFYAENCENLVEVRGLYGSESLRCLVISGCTSLGQSLDLSNLKHLWEFYAANCENLVEIRGLDRSKYLRGLDISGCTFLRCSPDLSNLKHLWKFYAANCENLVEIRGLGRSKSVRDLDISGCTSLRQSPELSNLKNLKNFYAANCKNLIEIRNVNGLESLKDLDISGCTTLRQSPDLSNLKNLKNFNAANCKNLVEIRGLDGSESLRYLDISGCTSLRQSLDLSNLKHLWKFYAANCENLVEIRGLYGLESLEELDISRCTSIRQSLDLSNLKHLWKFYATSCKNLVEIRGLDGLESLEGLYISGCTSLKQSLDLSNLKHLWKFHAANCENLVEIQGLDGSEFLRGLDISGCRSLRQTPDLSNLKNLKYFYAANCENLVEIRGLDRSKSLRDLNISGCTSLRQSMDLSNLKNMKNFYAANCQSLVEIQGLHGLESLEDLDISGCTSLRQSLNLSNLKHLWKFYATNCKNIVYILGLDGLESLKELDISGCTSLRQSLEVSNLKHLWKFYAANCENLVEIRGLDGLESLEDLNISGCTSLGQSLDLLNLKRLWKFYAANCENLVEIRGLDGLESLRELDISGCTSLRQSLHLSNAANCLKKSLLQTTPLKMQREGSGPSILLPREGMKKMNHGITPRAADMETSDKNYAIAAVQNVVGIDGCVKHITDLLEMEVNEEVRIIGIYGTDGIGKTTLAKAVYDRICSCFDSCSFLAEVEETTQNPHGLQALQTKLICDILDRDREDPSFDERIEFFLDIFREMKVLIVVDDVEKQSHLHAIVGDQLHWFGLGSRIIVTSTNSEILKECDPGKARTYMIRQLDNGRAFELFCKHAFRMQSSIYGYHGLANRIVNATVKLPLVVEVIGSFLRGKSIEEWQKMEELMKQSTTSSKKITVGCKEILDICYKALAPKQKHIFLDIACLFSGVDTRIASYMWPNSYLPSSDCILMPLAKIGENNELQMHRLLRCLGKRILDQEESEGLIWRKFYMQDMVPKAISREKEMDNIEALCFDLDDHDSCIFTARDFESMRDISFLKLGNAKVSGDFAVAFPSLRWLCWQRCPLDFGAINFVLRELIILDLSWSKVTEDWGGWREIKMEKLKVLNLTSCSDLLITPDFSGYKDLEILILERCSRLVKLDSSIGHLKRLVSLNLKFCSQFNSLPVELGCLTTLKELFIDGTSVREIPISIGNLKQLKILSGFKCFSLTHLPSSISCLTALSILSLDGSKITELPSSLGELLNLRRLSLRDCCYMQELPDSIGKLGSSLEELDISATSISKLPESFRNLQSLRVLRMDSSFIRAFPGEIGNLTKLEELHASWCRSLKGTIPGDIKRLHHLRSLTLGHSGISSLPSEISTISSLQTLDLLQCNEIEVLPELPPSLICLRVSSKRLKAIPFLSDLKELEELCLSDEDSKECGPPSKQLMPVSKVKQLLSLWFSRLWNLVLLLKQRIDKQSCSISSPKLRKLELSLSQIISLHFMYEPTDIPQLKTLILSGLSLEEVSELPKTMSVFSIQGCSSLKRLPTVQGLKNISVFKLYHSAIEEIEGLEGLKALKRLDISNCKIQNLNGIGRLTSLRSLILSHCDYLNNLPDLSNLKLLKVLEIKQCKMIHQIEGLEELTSLEKLNISECQAENSVQVQNALKHVMARSIVT